MKKLFLILLSAIMIFTLYCCTETVDNTPSSAKKDPKLSKQTYIKIHNTDTGYTGTGVKVAIIDSGYLTGSKDINYKGIVKGGNYTLDTSYKDFIPHAWSSIVIWKATPNNGIGTKGLIPNVKVQVYKIFDSDGGGATNSQVAKAINRAVADGCDVINCSFGSPQYSNQEKKAIENAIAQGIIVVAAAGNDSSNDPIYPADFPGVIKVGSCDENKQLSDFSNTGGVDCLAFGDYVYSQTTIDRYNYVSGTSFSAPIISALAVMCKQVDPSITPARFEKVLKHSGTLTNKSDSKGYGCIDFKKAIKYVKKTKKQNKPYSTTKVVYELF